LSVIFRAYLSDTFAEHECVRSTFSMNRLAAIRPWHSAFYQQCCYFLVVDFVIFSCLCFFSRPYQQSRLCCSVASVADARRCLSSV